MQHVAAGRAGGPGSLHFSLPFVQCWDAPSVSSKARLCVEDFASQYSLRRWIFKSKAMIWFSRTSCFSPCRQLDKLSSQLVSIVESKPCFGLCRSSKTVDSSVQNHSLDYFLLSECPFPDCHPTDRDSVRFANGNFPARLPARLTEIKIQKTVQQLNSWSLD